MLNFINWWLLFTNYEEKENEWHIDEASKSYSSKIIE